MKTRLIYSLRNVENLFSALFDLLVVKDSNKQEKMDAVATLPSVKLSIGNDVNVILCQHSDEKGDVEIVMNAWQFSNTIYSLKAIERQLLIDGQKEHNNLSIANYGIQGDEDVENCSKTPIESANFNELFSCPLPNDVSPHLMYGDDQMVDVQSTNEEKSTNLLTVDRTYQQQSEQEEYDPVKFCITQPGERDEGKEMTEMETDTFDEQLYRLYHPSTVTVKRELAESDAIIEQARFEAPPPPPPSPPPPSVNYETEDVFVKKSEKRVTARVHYLEKYAKLLCEKFWQVSDARCSNPKNYRAFLKMSIKAKIGNLFDELHTSVTVDEFDRKVCCPLGKEIFITCSKTKVKLINKMFKLISK